jgi:hypothetical protein
MAREPYKSRMLEMLDKQQSVAGSTSWKNEQMLRLSFVELAGSSCADVDAYNRMALIFKEVWGYEYVPPRFYVAQIGWVTMRWAVYDSSRPSSLSTFRLVASYDSEAEARQWVLVMNGIERDAKKAAS